MGIFDDKVYQEMDWLERACEPVRSELNEALHSMPDMYELTYDDIVDNFLKGTHTYFGEIYQDSCISMIPGASNYGKKCGGEGFSKIAECYDLQCNDSFTIDTENKVIKGEGRVRLVKTKEFFTDEELLKLLGRDGSHILWRMNGCRSTERLNDIIELMGLEEARKSRSCKKKVRAIVDEYERVMNKNEWNIRDLELSNRIATWIYQYVINGNLAAYSNFCKLKVMTHDDAPIYSIDGEEKV